MSWSFTVFLILWLIGVVGTFIPVVPATLTFAISLIDDFASAWGALIGGVADLFIRFGLMVGPLAGALLAERLIVRRPFAEAFRSAWGTLVGLLTGIAAKFAPHPLIGGSGLWRLRKPERSVFL